MKRIYSLLMAVIIAVTAGALPVFAADPTMLTFDSGGISITGDAVRYINSDGSDAGQVAVNPNGYTITGVQTAGKTLQIADLSVPVALQTTATATGDVKIADRGKLKIPSNAALKGNVAIASGGSLDVLNRIAPATEGSLIGNIDVVAGGTATVAGTLTGNATVAGDLTVAPSGKLTGNTTVASGGELTLVAGGTINGDVAIAPTGEAAVEGALTGNATVAGKLVFTSGGNMTGKMNVTSGGLLTINPRMTVTGDVTIASGGTAVIADGNLVGNATVEGALTLSGGYVTGNVKVTSGGNLTLAQGAKVTGTVTVAAGGTFTNNGGTIGATNAEVTITLPSGGAESVFVNGAYKTLSATNSILLTPGTYKILVEAKDGNAYVSSVTVGTLPTTAPAGVLQFSGGWGTSVNPYKIANATDFANISGDYLINGYNYILTGSFALGASLPGDFKGSFNGNGQTLTLNTPSGVFTTIGAGGSVSNLRTTGTVSGGANAGGIAGTNLGSISGCYSTANVSGGTVGGIAGTNNAAITNCIATGTISGANTGGIAGYNAGTISGSNALGLSVTGTTMAGHVAPNGALSGNQFWKDMSVKIGVNAVAPNGGTALTTDQAKTILSNAGLAIPAYPAVNPTPPPSNGGGGGDYEPPYNETFWKEVTARIKDADSGDTLKISASKADNVPVSILKLIKGKNITLQISHGKDKITINGKRMHPIPGNRIFYTFEDLADLYEDQPVSSSKPASSSAASSKPPVVTAPVTSAPQWTWTPPASSAVSSSSSEPEESSEPSSSEEIKEVIPEEDPEESEVEVDAEPEKPKRSMAPLIIAGVVVLLVLIGGGVAFYIYRNKTEDFYGFDDEDK